LSNDDLMISVWELLWGWGFNPPSLCLQFPDLFVCLGVRKWEKFESENVHGAICCLLCCFYAHSAQSSTMSHPLHHILDSTCASTSYPKTFPQAQSKTLPSDRL